MQYFYIFKSLVLRFYIFNLTLFGLAIFSYLIEKIELPFASTNVGVHYQYTIKLKTEKNLAFI